MSRWHLLVVDDDPIIRRTLVSQLLTDGYTVSSAANGPEALTLVEKRWPDLALLDLIMPGGMDGFELADRLRRYVELPVIMLTSMADEATTVTGLERHADDYVTKPFRYAELRARINKLLSRFYQGAHQPGEIIIVDDALTINLGQHLIIRDGVTLSLEPIETRILALLLQTPTTPVLTATLLRRAWGTNEEGDQSSLWVRIRSLRRKLEPDPANPIYLQTVRGIGYVWAVNPRRGIRP